MDLNKILADPNQPVPMDAEAFRKYGKEMIDRVADYWLTIRERRPMPAIKPGEVRSRLPTDPPEQAEPFEAIFADLENIVFAGNTNWHHPQFHAYYPTACSYPAIVADILSAGLSCIGFTWASSPACTEVEMVMMDWLVKALGLPEHFLFSHPGSGGGIIQCTASDSTLVALLAARSRKIRQVEANDINNDTHGNDTDPDSSRHDAPLNDVRLKLVVYCSEQAHSSVERAGLLAAVKVRALETDDQHSLRGSTLEFAIQEDIAKGLVPFAVVATLGTTPCCSFDNLSEIGDVCQRHEMWLHVDAAYAGSAFVCPEYRHFMDGIEYASSFNFNPHKWLLVNFDCSPMWFKDSLEVEQAFHVDPLYLKHANQGLVPDYRHWQIPLGRRFRALKLWFVFRAFGVAGLRAYIRKMVALAHEMEALLRTDERFEITVPTRLGLVCFCIKNQPNEVSEKLLTALNEDGRIHLVPSVVKDVYMLRLAICSSLTTMQDLQLTFKAIKETTDKVLSQI